jgi:hypothetical protein
MEINDDDDDDGRKNEHFSSHLYTEASYSIFLGQVVLPL